MAKQKVKSPQIDWGSLQLNIKAANNTSSIAPGNSVNTNYASVGCQITFTVAASCKALVTVNMGVRSTTDYELKPLIYLDGVMTAIADYSAAMSNGAGNRMLVRPMVAVVTIPSGTHTLSAGVFVASATSPSTDIGSAQISAIVLGEVTA